MTIINKWTVTLSYFYKQRYQLRPLFKIARIWNVPSRHVDPKKKTFKRRPYLDVFKWFSWEILKDVLKRTSYVRPEKNILCTSWKERLMNVLNRTSYVSLKDVVFKSLIFFLPHSVEDLLMYGMCYQLQKIENKKYQFQKFPIINCIFAQKNPFFFATI